MEAAKFQFRRIPGGDRGTILLLDDAPQRRTARAENLMRRGFDVKLASTVQQAEALWRPDDYVLVLVAVRKRLERAIQLCDRIKQEHPRQTIGLLVPPEDELPLTTCPDLMWPEENLDYFLARVETLADFAAVV